MRHSKSQERGVDVPAEAVVPRHRVHWETIRSTDPAIRLVGEMAISSACDHTDPDGSATAVSGPGGVAPSSFPCVAFRGTWFNGGRLV